MKKVVTVIIGLALGLSFIFAQKGHEMDKKKIEEFLSKKIEYLVKEAELTEEEKAKFVPLYRKYEGEKFKMFKNAPSGNMKIGDESNMTEEDFKNRNEIIINERVNRAVLDRVYYERFREFLSEKKINKLYKAERAYKMVLMKELEEKGRNVRLNNKKID